MFVHFTDSEGRETWVNPMQVRVVRDHKGLLGGKRGTEIWFSLNNTSEAVYVPLPPSEVAAQLGAALAPYALPPLGDDDEPGGSVAATSG